jgi:hypothetical protein
MKIKKPSLTGMKNCEYLGHFAQDKFIQQGHNDSGKVRYLMDNKSMQGGGGGEPGGGPGGDFSTGKARPQPRSASEYVSEKKNRINWNAQKDVVQNEKAKERFDKYTESGQSRVNNFDEALELTAVKKMSGDMPSQAEGIARSVSKRMNKGRSETYKRNEAANDWPWMRASDAKESLSMKASKARANQIERQEIQDLKNAANTAGKAAFIGTSIVGSRGHLGDKKEEELRKKRKK